MTEAGHAGGTTVRRPGSRPLALRLGAGRVTWLPRGLATVYPGPRTAGGVTSTAPTESDAVAVAGTVEKATGKAAEDVGDGRWQMCLQQGSMRTRRRGQRAGGNGDADSGQIPDPAVSAVDDTGAGGVQARASEESRFFARPGVLGQAIRR